MNEVYALLLQIIANSPEGSQLTALDTLDGTESFLVFKPGEKRPFTITKEKTVFPGEGVSTYLGLTDTPSTYLGQKGKIVVVKQDESGFEYKVLAEVTGVDQSTFDLLEDRVLSLETKPDTIERQPDFISFPLTGFEDTLYVDEEFNIGYLWDDFEGLYFPLNAITAQAVIDALGITPANDAEVVKSVNDNLPDVNGNVIIATGTGEINNSNIRTIEIPEGSLPANFTKSDCLAYLNTNGFVKTGDETIRWKTIATTYAAITSANVTNVTSNGFDYNIT